MSDHSPTMSQLFAFCLHSINGVTPPGGCVHFLLDWASWVPDGGAQHVAVPALGNSGRELLNWGTIASHVAQLLPDPQTFRMLPFQKLVNKPPQHHKPLLR